MHGGRGGASRRSLLLFNGCGGAEERSAGVMGRRGCVCKGGHSLSFVGRGFFSCVSVFFSLFLSNSFTSEMSGLSLMVAGFPAAERGIQTLSRRGRGLNICHLAPNPPHYKRRRKKPASFCPPQPHISITKSPARRAAGAAFTSARKSQPTIRMLIFSVPQHPHVYLSLTPPTAKGGTPARPTSRLDKLKL